LRLLPGEAEILTLAVQPEARRQGLGRLLVQELIAQATGAERVFLEVAESNQAARALYAACGFEEIGRRPGYYAYSDGGAEDALVMQLVRQKTRPTQNPPP
ncbi:MAG: GNAT family N-acetyltransferase, partial [Pseudomonadota bacterium]